MWDYGPGGPGSLAKRHVTLEINDPSNLIRFWPILGVLHLSAHAGHDFISCPCSNENVFGVFGLQTPGRATFSLRRPRGQRFLRA